MNIIFDKIKKGVQHPEKILPYIDNKISLYRSIHKLQMPKNIYITINNICNLRCCMCDVGQKNIDSNFYGNLIKDNTLTLQEWMNFVDSIKDYKPNLFIVGTEPLLYKDLGKLITYAKKHGLYVGVGTNGYVLEKVARELVDSKLDELSISLDGPAAIHDKIRCIDGVYEKVMSGMMLIKQLEETNSRIKIKVNYCISNYNYDCLYNFITGLERYFYPDEITFSHLNFTTDEMSSLHNKLYPQFTVTNSCLNAVDPQKVRCDILWKEINRVKRYHTKTNIGFIPDMKSQDDVYKYYNKPLTKIKDKQCFVPWISTSIQANGDVIILARCGIQIDIGNIRNKDLKELWYGDSLQDFRDILNKNKMFPACTRCCGVLS